MAFSDCIVGNEGFSLTMVDRDIAFPDEAFSRTFGDENGPVAHAIAVVRAQGSVALADIGCGTGNTLSTWQSKVLEATQAERECVTGTGVTLSDYAPFRDADAKQAWQSPTLTYVVRDIARGVSKIASNSVDSIIANKAVDYWKRPEDGFDEIERIARPGAQLLFNIGYPPDNQNVKYQNRGISVVAKMEEWEQKGHDVTPKNKIIQCDFGELREMFYRVIFAEDPQI